MKVTMTKYGDRWDLLAYDLLGDAALVKELMAANPELVSVFDDYLPEGVEVVIPVVYADSEQITKVKVPMFKIGKGG